MVQLEKCVQRLIALLAENYDPVQPLVFSKIDIKYRFWRLAVSDKDFCNFCYILPQTMSLKNIDDTLIVIPKCLQMGWRESPPSFYTAYETAVTSLPHFYKKYISQPTPLKIKC